MGGGSKDFILLGQDGNYIMGGGSKDFYITRMVTI